MYKLNLDMLGNATPHDEFRRNEDKSDLSIKMEMRTQQGFGYFARIACPQEGTSSDFELFSLRSPWEGISFLHTKRSRPIIIMATSMEQ